LSARIKVTNPNSDKPKPNRNALHFTISELKLLISINPTVIQRGHVSTSNPMVNNFISISKSMVKCKININIDFTDYTDFHNHYQSV